MDDLDLEGEASYYTKRAMSMAYPNSTELCLCPECFTRLDLELDLVSWWLVAQSEM